MLSRISFCSLLITLTVAREVPENLQAYYDQHKDLACGDVVAGPFSSGQGGLDTVYCRDPSSGALFLKDTRKGFADADIDCDGVNAGEGDCHLDESGQPVTAFKDTAKSYGIEDLDSHIHNYVVLGNSDNPNPSDNFDPERSLGIKPLSVVAVVCGGKLVYGVWGDINGGTLTGETSLSLAQMCFPDEEINGDSGHTEHDVLMVAFPGEDAVPGEKANWHATTREEFEESLAEVGDALVAKLGNAGHKSRIMRATL